jgi:hypothetical protein
MTYTLEARWFGPSPLPTALSDWFHTLGAADTTTQTDLYLPSADPALNVKLRGDQLQIKRRLAGPHELSLGPRAVGRCEEWVKWSFPLSETPSLWDADPTDLWVRVEKTRRQCSFAPSAQSDLASDLPTSPSATIDAELTTLEAAGETAWTFCLETTGPTESLLNTLQTAAPHLLDEDLPVPFSADQSFGYVQWFQELPTVSQGPASNALIPDLM